MRIACLAVAALSAFATQAADAKDERGISVDLSVTGLASRSSYDEDLFNAERYLISRLRWYDISTVSGELGGRFTHEPSGIFVKLNAGFGRNIGGVNDDSDFLDPEKAADINALFPNGIPGGPKSVSTGQMVSNTRSKLDDRSTWNYSADIGIRLVETEKFKLSPFVGYVKIRDRYMALGDQCRPDDVNNTLCTNTGAPENPDEQTLGSKITWSGPRIGAEIGYAFSPDWSLVSSVAYMPKLGRFVYDDSHFLRVDTVGPTPNFKNRSDDAWGVMAEVGVARKLSDVATFETGVRAWRFSAERAVNTVGPTFEDRGDRADFLLKRVGGYVKLTLHLK